MTTTPERTTLVKSKRFEGFDVPSKQRDKENPFIYSIVVCCALHSIVLFSGCAGISDSLHFQSTALIKVPIDRPIASASGDGWEFRHILEAPNDAERRGEWYVARNDKQPFRFGGLIPAWPKLFSRAPEIALATHQAFGAYPVLIEPNRTFGRFASKQPPEPQPGQAVPSQYGNGVKLVINAAPMDVWSDDASLDPRRPGRLVVDPMWHLDDHHSQLASARNNFDRPGDQIVIAHLDNGLDGRHSGAPMRLQRNDPYANAVGLLNSREKFTERDAKGKPLPPEQTGATHGLGTVGILAGGWVSIDPQTVRGRQIKGYDGWLGGAPFATVVPIRVAPWVFSIGTAELAYGIDYASRVKHADVITMSHGGAPTQAWVDAVNAAYERGTAIFAAEGDFFSAMPDPLPPNGIIVPASPMYPAAFRRVIGVTGVTADQRSYGRNTLGWLLKSPTAIFQWMARGSYGADGTSTIIFRPNKIPDESQTWRQGQLRPYPIAAYSPNIPWLSLRRSSDQWFADGVDLNGSGTSAATPQVAAAAALWLQRHRHEFSEQEWHHWQKAEAVYYALLKSADRGGRIEPDKYLGAGTLKANDALKLSYSKIKHARRPPGYYTPENVPKGSLWFEETGNDYFDGARSFFSLFGFQTRHHVAPTDRAGLRQRPARGERENVALQRLYYNMMLLRKWHGGGIPRKEEECAYWLRAGRKAKTQFANASDNNVTVHPQPKDFQHSRNLPRAPGG
jgi:subtilisin family serine protease